MQDIASENSYVLLHWSKLIVSHRSFLYVRMIFQFYQYVLELVGCPPSQTTRLTDFFINGWLRRWIHNKFRPIASLRPFLTFVQRCRHFLDYSASGGTSLQLHMYALIQNFDGCKVTSESPDELPCPLVSHEVSEIVKISCADPVQ
jgi:hypothetical protein